jgi:hypothetical protein
MTRGDVMVSRGEMKLMPQSDGKVSGEVMDPQNQKIL